MWLEHLGEVHKNRVEGGERAATKGEGEHGRMIDCDGYNCPLIWYHANCVGLSEETIRDGSWFCEQCKH